MITTLVLPCYNPPEGWADTVVENYKAFCERVGHTVELIVVLDGPSAETTDTALSTLLSALPAVKVLRHDRNRGKGYAIRTGVASATGDIVLYTDIDFPYTADSIYKVYSALRSKECDVAAGVKDEAYYRHVPALRRVISRYLQMLIRIFLSMPMTDTQCGLKGFNSSVKPLFLQTTIDRYLFDLEFIRNCYRSGLYTVKAIPVQLNDNVRFRRMNYRILLPEMLNFIRLLYKK